MSFGDLKVQDLIYEDSSNNEITVVIADLATKANPTFTGTVTVPTPTAGDNSTKAASTAFVVASFATKASPTFTGTINGADLILSGNLTVSGTQTIINTNVLQVEDKHIEIGKVSSPSDTTADGGGIILKASSDRTFLWVNSTDAWTSSEHIQVASGKTFIGDGSTLTALNATNLASGTVATARLGTGTASSSNFLRGDGSWQTIATDKIEEGNTSVETVDTGSDGYVKITTEGTERVRVIADGKVGIGTGAPEELLHIKAGSAPAIQLEAYAGGPYKSLIKMGGNDMEIRGSSGSIEFFTGNADGDSSSEKLRIGAAGQLGIGGATYGDSGQVLTSGGASAAPSWTTISAAPTITATVDGSLSAGDAVIVKSTGNIEKVTKTITIANPITHSSVLTTSGNNIDSKLVYDKLTGYTVRVWWDNSNNRAGKMQALEIEAGTNNPVNVGSEVTWRNNNTYYVHAAGDGKGRVLVTYRDTGDDRCACKLMNVASDGTLTGHGSAWIGATNSGRTYVTYVPDDDLFVVLYVEGSNMFARTVTVQPNGTSISVGSVSSQIDSGYFDNPYGELLHYDEYSNKLVACGWKSSYLRAISGTVSGTNTSWNSGVNISGNGNSNTQGNYDCLTGESDTGLMLSAFKRGSSYSNYGGAVGFKVNGNGFTAGSETTFRSVDCVPAGMEYNTGINRICLAYSQGSPASWGTMTIAINSSTLALTLGNAKELTGTENYAREGSMVYDIAKSRMIILGRHNSNNSQRVISAYYGATTTNMTVDNFIGFSADSYSNGNTGTIKVTGNKSTQSSLTPGQKYYVQIDNTLATTADSPSVVAGIALSATKLLIKG